MLKKLSNFVVNHRIAILIFMLVLAAASLVCSTFVEVNEDMTKYLPDDSNMKAGIDIMAEEFPEMETANTIRVMFDDLSDDEKAAVAERLAAIEHVDSVDHDSESSDYNKDNHTLFVLTISCDYNSREEKAIEAALEEQFADYTMVWQNDDTSAPIIPPLVLVIVGIMLLAILFFMCSSWLAPILFLAAIGIAIFINAGTNIFLGSVSSVTNSIAAILQLALSMDYSVILMNRYRQERELEPDKVKAMKIAWANAFSSVASSSLTTVVGLLMLVFMSFKIGADLGIVLAKGVFISMICVLTVLPALTILFDGLIEKTAKKEPHIPMGWAAGLSHKLRWGAAALFIILFVGAYFLQQQTDIAYTLVKDDAVADVFPRSNMVVMVYENEDEPQTGGLVSALEDDDRVSSVMGYTATLAKPLTADELTDVLGDMGGDIALEPEMLAMLYYDYHTGGEVGTMTAAEFMSFISENVLDNEAFADYIGEDMAENADLIAKFADDESLQKPMTAKELAKLFGMADKDIEDLFLLYQIENGEDTSHKLTLGEFADFVINDVANHPDYGEMFDAATLAGLEQLAIFTDADRMTTPYTYNGIASIMGISPNDARLMFIYYYSMADGYDPGTMTLPQFISFLKNDLANDAAFSGYIDPETLAQIDTLSAFTDKASLQQKRSAAELAAILGIDENMVRTIFILHNAQDVSGKTMTMPQFSGFLKNNLLNDPMFSLYFDENTKAQLTTLDALAQAASAGYGLTAGQMGAILGMDTATVSQLYFLYFSNDDAFRQEAAGMTMTLADFLSLLKANAPADQLAQLEQTERIIDAAASGRSFTAAELAALTGSSENQMEMLFKFQDPPAETMTMAEFVKVASRYSNDSQLKQFELIVQAAASGETLSAAQLAGIFGITQEQVQQTFMLALAQQKTVPLAAFTSFLVSDVMQNPAYSGGFSAEQQVQLTTMNQLVQLAGSGIPLSSAELAQAFGMEESMTRLVFRLYFGGDIGSKTMSLEETMGFILSDPVMSGYMDGASMSQLQMLQKIISASSAGTAFTVDQMSQLLGMDKESMKMMFTIYDTSGNMAGRLLSTQTVVNFLADNRGALGDAMGGSMSEITTAQAIINGSVSGTAYTADSMAALMGMTSDQASQLYLLYTDMHGDTSGWKLSVEEFIDFLNTSVLTNSDYADMIDSDAKKKLTSAEAMVKAVIGGREYTAAEMSEIFAGLSEDVSESSLELMYLYAESTEKADPTWTMTMEGLFGHLTGDILSDPRFESFIDEDMRREILDNEVTLADGKAQLLSDDYSRLIITTTYPEESADTTAFIRGIHDYAGANFTGDYYLIGNSPMNYEMQQTFDGELLFITLITALAIFIIVLLTFRSLSVPLILVLLVQCGVYITVTITGIISGSIYYLALLIVECILMGATIDYGILFTNYYCENRAKFDVKESLKKAYEGSIHTIMTSGLILVTITAVIGRLFEDATVAAIVKTISIGSFCAIMLILFVLPGVLAVCDRLVVRKKKD